MAHRARVQRPAVFPALALLAGVAIAPQSPLPGLLAGWTACAFLIVGLWAHRRSARIKTVLLGISGLLAGCWLESVSSSAHRASVEALFADGQEVRELSFVGELLAPPSIDWEGQRWLRIRGFPERESVAGREPYVIRLRVRTRAHRESSRLDALRSGDRVRVWSRLRRSPAPRLRSRGVHATGSVKSERLVELLQRTDRVGAIDTVRNTARSRLHTVLRDDRAALALASAMLLGDRERMEPDQRRLLRDAGLLHLVAISGLHVGLLIVTLHWGLGRIRVDRWFGLLVLGSLLVGFTVGVGSRPSVLRAAIGCAVLLFGRCLGREGEALNGLALIAATLVALRPASLYDPGFQLTFLATAGILGLAGPITRALPFGGPLAGSLAVSTSAYLVTAPAVALHFRWLAPVGLLSNLLAVPLCAGVLVAGYTALLAPGLPLVGELNAWALRRVVHGLLGVGTLAASWDRGAFCVATPSPLLIVAYYLLLASLAIYARRGGRGAVGAAGRGLLGLALTWLHLGAPPNAGGGRLEAAVIDVGQGLSVALQGPRGSHLLVDAGGSTDRRFDPGERIVVPYLFDTAGPRLAALVVTHDHIDHLGGAFSVLREMEVGELWFAPGSRHSARIAALADLARSRGTAVVLAQAGVVAELDGTPVRVLAPAPGSSEQGNDRSVVILAGRAPSRLLVPGDLEDAGEEALLASGVPLRAEALVLTHHGSRHGSSLRFLQQVAPDWALVSCGRRNPFGHPHREVVERLERLGVPLLRTDELGSIRIRSATGGWEPTGD